MDAAPRSPKDKKTKDEKQKSPQSFMSGLTGMGGQWNNLTTSLVIILILAIAYSYVGPQANKATDVSLSTLASDVRGGLVKEISVSGNQLTAKYTDDTEKKAKKESDAALSETLSRYGVTGEELSKVSIEIKDETGFKYWFFSLAPIILPLILIAVFIWFLSRQVKGAGTARSSGTPWRCRGLWEKKPF
jgi:ATP-dependent Zn protease